MGVPPTVPGIPERHSTPARFCFTAASTSASHPSPAPALRVPSSPCVGVFTPRMATCSTRPLKPSSETTTLLPPPSTNTDSSCHSDTAGRWSTCVARANQRAAPPMPSVVSGASGTCSCRRSTCTEHLCLFRQRGNRLEARTQRELDPVAGRKLTRERKSGSDDRGDLWISTGSLSIRHQQDRITRRRNLNATGEGGVGNHRTGGDSEFVARHARGALRLSKGGIRDSRTRHEAIAHPV